MTRGELLRTLIGHKRAVSSVAFSPDGMTLASGSRDNTIKLWNGKSGELLRTLSGHGNKVTSVAFSPDGTILASGSDDCTIKLWDVHTGAIKVTFTRLPGTEWIAYQPGKLVYVSSLRGDEYAAIRFDHQFRPVYPLEYYREELKHKGNLFEAFSLPQPESKPKPMHLWWDTTENKGVWVWGGGLSFVVLTTFVVALVLRKRQNACASRR